MQFAGHREINDNTVVDDGVDLTEAHPRYHPMLRRIEALPRCEEMSMEEDSTDSSTDFLTLNFVESLTAKAPMTTPRLRSAWKAASRQWPEVSPYNPLR